MRTITQSRRQKQELLCLQKILKTIHVIKPYNMSYDERMQMGLNGQKYVLENHDFTALGAKLEKALFESITIYKESKTRLGNNFG